MGGEEQTLCNKLHHILRHNPCAKVTVFLVILVLDACDLASDWLLYHDVSSVEEGLVYGPVQFYTVYALLFFSIIGVVTFSFELLNMAKEIFFGTPWINVESAMALVIWVEDIPQISINVVIASCREEAISYFQLTKASVIVFGVIIRLIIGIIRACREKERPNIQTIGDKLKATCRVFNRFLVLLGLCLMFCGSMTVFFFTQTDWKLNGELAFHVPSNLWEGEFHNEKYFTDVGIFFHHPIMNRDQKEAGAVEKQVNWVKLVGIFDLHDLMDKTVQLEFNSQKTKLVIRNMEYTGKIIEEECYKIEQSSQIMLRHENCSDIFDPGESKSSLVFRFLFIEPRNHLILGDIVFNAKMQENGTCMDIASAVIESPSQKALMQTEAEALMSSTVIRYFRTKPITDSNHHLVWNSKSNASFYQQPLQLEQITEVWKTGFLRCECSGSKTPHLDPDISIPCYTVN